jgi:hypothetical protein
MQPPEGKLEKVISVTVWNDETKEPQVFEAKEWPEHWNCLMYVVREPLLSISEMADLMEKVVRSKEYLAFRNAPFGHVDGPGKDFMSSYDDDYFVEFFKQKSDLVEKIRKGGLE